MKALPMNINKMATKDILFCPIDVCRIEIREIHIGNPPTIIILTLPSLPVSYVLILKKLEQFFTKTKNEILIPYLL